MPTDRAGGMGCCGRPGGPLSGITEVVEFVLEAGADKNARSRLCCKAPNLAREHFGVQDL